MKNAENRPAAEEVPGVEEWRDLVREALGGHDPAELNAKTRDAILVEPLCAGRRDGASLAGRGARLWTIVQTVDDPDPDAANRQALADLTGGATGLSLRLTGAPAAAGFGLPADAASLRIALEGVDLAAIHLRLEPHADQLAAAGWLRDIVERSGNAPERTNISFGLDPVAALATRVGDVAIDPRAFAACVRGLATARFRGPLAVLDGRLYHEAGATEAQELAGIIAAAAWWLRALDETGLAPADALPLLGPGLAVDRDLFLSTAKLRALRLLWARLQELCDAGNTPPAVHAETSRRMLTRADPTTNLLRTTLATFAAAVGGANVITALPHTAALGLADGNAHALARNMQHLLIEEAHLYRVEDAAAGSGTIEALTDALAEHAWTAFQEIEREGGIIASLSAGAFQARIAEARAALERDMADGAEPLVGATLYRAPDDATNTTPPPPDAPIGLGLAAVRLEDLAKAAA